MPTWDSPPDVRFDHAAADHLAATAQMAATDLDDLRSGSRARFDAAAATWHGRARERAEEHLMRWWSALDAAIDDLRALVTLLATARAAAEAEQARRRAAQVRWHAETEAEQLAAAQESRR